MKISGMMSVLFSVTAIALLSFAPPAAGWNWVQDYQAADVLWAVHGYGTLNAWAGGSSGFIYAYDSGTWSLQTTVTGRVIRSLLVQDPTHVWAGADDGYIFFFDGVSWTQQTCIAFTGSVNGLSGTGASDVWAVTGGRDIFHYDGVS